MSSVCPDKDTIQIDQFQEKKKNQAFFLKETTFLITDCHVELLTA
jgi:hypothetical protein